MSETKKPKVVIVVPTEDYETSFKIIQLIESQKSFLNVK